MLAKIQSHPGDVDDDLTRWNGTEKCYTGWYFAFSLECLARRWVTFFHSTISGAPRQSDARWRLLSLSERSERNRRSFHQVLMDSSEGAWGIYKLLLVFLHRIPSLHKSPPTPLACTMRFLLKRATIPPDFRQPWRSQEYLCEDLVCE